MISTCLGVVAGGPPFLAVRDELVGCDLRVGLKADERHDGLAALVARDADDRGLADGRDVLDLTGDTL